MSIPEALHSPIAENSQGRDVDSSGDTTTFEPTVRPSPSAHLLADTIFANGLGANPHGLLPSDVEEMDAVEALLPLRQRMSDVMIAAHETVDTKLGSALATSTLAELQALRTQITLREKQLLTTTKDPDELFGPIEPGDHGFSNSVIPRSPTHQTDQESGTKKLSLVEYVQIREENADLAETVSIRATADLVQYLRKPGVHLEIPGQRRGQTPLTAATSFVASTLRLTFAAVDKRISAAAAMWPEMQYRRTKLVTPELATHLEQGRLSLATASAAQQKLSDIRQAVRRAGGDAETADDLVSQKEQEFLRHALRNNAHTFSRYAKSRADAVTNELIGPARPLTDDQFKHEKGLFYDGPIGDSLHRITAVVDDGELLHLKAFRELASKFHSAIAELQPDGHEPETQRNLRHDDENAADDVPNHERITPADVDLGIAELFDGRTTAERWLNTVMDFLSAGLILRKTYRPDASTQDQQRRDDTLRQAAKYSQLLTDILGMDSDTTDPNSSQESSDRSDRSSGTNPNAPPDALEAFIPAGYQLLRPNLDTIVQITLGDLVGRREESDDETANDYNEVSEVAKIAERLKDPHFGSARPIGSPGNVEIDYGLARQQACDGRIIPMVLGTASQPLDVGRSQRLFPRAIRRALHVRDRGCVVPGCHVPAEWCQAHHIDPWEHGGSTTLDNAALTCRHHHGAAHKDLLQIHMEPDGRPSVSLPPAIDSSGTRYRNVFWQNA